MSYNPIKWIISISGGGILALTQNPSEQDPEFEKNVTYEKTIDSGTIRIVPLKIENRVDNNMSFQWSGCNASQAELLEEIFKNDYKVKIVSHHGLNKIKQLGSSAEGLFGFAGWEGFFDEFLKKQRRELSSIYYEVSVKMSNVRELDQSEIQEIIDQVSA